MAGAGVAKNGGVAQWRQWRRRLSMSWRNGVKRSICLRRKSAGGAMKIWRKLSGENGGCVCLSNVIHQWRRRKLNGWLTASAKIWRFAASRNGVA